MNAICIYLLQIGKIDPTLQTHLDWFRAMFLLSSDCKAQRACGDCMEHRHFKGYP